MGYAAVVRFSALAGLGAAGGRRFGETGKYDAIVHIIPWLSTIQNPLYLIFESASVATSLLRRLVTLELFLIQTKFQNVAHLLLLDSRC